MTDLVPQPARSEVAEGMRIDWDVPVVMDDGVVLRADVFRPDTNGRFPVILSYGPYAKGLPFQVGYPGAWSGMVEHHPDTAAGSSNKYQNWEVVDPEKWVPDGYVCVRVDSRGCGRSPGIIDPFSPTENQDHYQCVEWAAEQAWCNGRVGLNGISYYAMNQWLVASLQPPHLAAMCAWEGSSDWYRDATHHGGIVSTFWKNWYDMQVMTVQNGLGEQGPRDPNSGLAVCGDEMLSAAQLEKHRIDLGAQVLGHPLVDDYHRDRSPDWSRVTVPLLSAGNWGGAGLHLRGNIEGFVRAASSQKWLEIHGYGHWISFYTEYGVQLQKRFFNYFLRDRGDWMDQPPVQLQVRHVDGTFVPRAESEWPLSRTRWTRLYLDAASKSLTAEKSQAEASLSYDSTGDGLTFTTAPLEKDTEATGPLAAKLFIASTSIDADIFLVVRAFSPQEEEVVFEGAIDPHTPVAQGWLRASHRKLDPALSLPYRPYHTHDDAQSLVAGIVHEIDVEIWPTCVVLPAGYRLALTVRGRDYVYPGPSGGFLSHFKNELLGCGPFLHDDPDDRPTERDADRVTLYTGGAHASYLLLPVIPPA